MSLIDVNDNRPEFGSSSYVSSILLKDAAEGKLLLTLSASDRDAGNNSLITYRSAADCCYTYTKRRLALPGIVFFGGCFMFQLVVQFPAKSWV